MPAAKHNPKIDAKRVGREGGPHGAGVHGHDGAAMLGKGADLGDGKPGADGARAEAGGFGCDALQSPRFLKIADQLNEIVLAIDGELAAVWLAIDNQNGITGIGRQAVLAREARIIKQKIVSAADRIRDLHLLS